MPSWSTRRLLPALVAAAALVAPAAAAAAAEVRTATLFDQLDIDTELDLARVDARTDTVAGTSTITVATHRDIPADPSDAAQYVQIDLRDTAGTDCAAAPGQMTGDATVRFAYDGVSGELGARYEVAPNVGLEDVPLTVASDRRSMSVTVTDPRLPSSDHRCLRAGAFSPSLGTSDTTAPVWFDGQAPQPPPPPPKPPTPPTNVPPPMYVPPPAYVPPPFPVWQPAPEPSSCIVPAVKVVTPVAASSGTSPTVELLGEGGFRVAGAGVRLAVRDQATGRQLWQTVVAPARFEGKEDEDLEPVPARVPIPARFTANPVVVAVAWEQRSDDGTDTCTVERKIGVRPGSRQAFTGRTGWPGVLELDGKCSAFRGEQTVVTVSARGRKARFSRTDACADFTGKARRIGGLKVVAKPGGVLHFTGSGEARVTVAVGGRSVLRRVVSGGADPSVREKVHEGEPNFSIFCKQHRKPIHKEPDGRRYCLSPRQSRRSVIFV